MIISGLNYSSIKTREREEAEKKRKALQKAQDERTEAQAQARFMPPPRAMGTQTEETPLEESLG